MLAKKLQLLTKMLQNASKHILKAYATAASPLALPDSASCSCGLFLGNILGHLGDFWDIIMEQSEVTVFVPERRGSGASWAFSELACLLCNQFGCRLNISGFLVGLAFVFFSSNLGLMLLSLWNFLG